MNSYFQDIEQHIIKQIRLTKGRLLIAVAWFTNQKIGDEIINKINTDIEIIIDDNKVNRNCYNLSRFQTKGIDIAFIKDLNKNYYLMHNKFCIIDNKLVITGSYNWTQNANSNDENITVLTDPTNVALYTHEFRRIKNIKFPSNDISISSENAIEITNLIYSSLLSLLKANITNLPKGLLRRWKDEGIKNRIRVIEEGLRNTLFSKIGHFGVYQELISRYGIEYASLASEIEKAEARDNFKKKGLEDTEYYIHCEFQFFKIRAIKKLQDNYAKLLSKKSTDRAIEIKIIKVHEFLTKEKMDIAKEINIILI